MLKHGNAAAANLALAERHYKLRFDELRELIIAEENAFKYGHPGSSFVCIYPGLGPF
jgi:hypothetical protein